MVQASSSFASSPATPKKKSRVIWFVLLGVVLMGALGGAVAYKKASSKKGVLVTTEKAVVKTITQLVSATGKIQPETEVKISPEVAGEIVELPFREGASVKKGDLLIKVKPDNYQAQVEQREADLAAARATSVQNQAQLAKAEEDFKRTQDVFSKNIVTESDFTAARTNAEVARANFQSSLANIRRAEGQLKQARDLLDKTVIYSPLDGSISSLSSELGERVVATGQFAGTEVMRVANLDSMEVRVNVNENDVVNVKVGDRARISIDAYPNRKFVGVVKEIASSAKTTGAMSQEEVTNFLVKIRISDRDVPLRPGMSANADIETKTVENVVAVPIQSVTVRSREGNKTIEQLAQDREKKAKESQGEGAASAVNERQQREREKSDRDSLQRVVFVKNGDKVSQVAVETGIADTSHLEIKSGVKEGDEVVSGSFSVITRTLKDGTEIRMEAPKKAGTK
ncbi:MAG TPA: efflux RND transporter periplasmic adaptor subunit [Opitutaceae bacterium]|nr:efflux RND transporter periplasmic adaptor subunit [Opitutaceae bacterium]